MSSVSGRTYFLSIETCLPAFLLVEHLLVVLLFFFPINFARPLASSNLEQTHCYLVPCHHIHAKTPYLYLEYMQHQNQVLSYKNVLSETSELVSKPKLDVKGYEIMQ